MENTIKVATSIESALNDLIEDNSIGLSPEVDKLTQDAREWSKSFRILEEILQKGPPFQWDAVSSFLTSGMRETLDILLNLGPGELALKRISQQHEQLGMRICFHAEAIELLSAHVERSCLRHTPNYPIEFGKINRLWFQQKTDLEATLKRGLGCSNSSDLLWDRLTTNQQTPKPPSSTVRSQSPSKSPDSTRLISKLKCELEASFQDCPQNICSSALLRATIYLLNKLHTSMHGMEQVKTPPLDSAGTLIHFYKCAWLVHNLIKNSESTLSLAWMNDITKLILGKLSSLTEGHQYQRFPLGDSIAFQPCDLVITDPLYGMDYDTYLYPDSDIVTEQSSQARFGSSKLDHQIASEMSTPPTTVYTRSETETSEIDRLARSLTELAPAEQTSEKFSLMVAVAADPMSERKWIPSEVSVSKQNDNHMQILRISSGSLHLEIAVDSETDELVPEYAFKTVSRNCQPALWFRNKIKQEKLFFSAMNGLEDLTDFTDCFVGDGELMSYFPLINKIEFQSKKRHGTLIFNNPTAQAWAAESEQIGRDLGLDLRSVQSWQIIPIAEPIEASKMLFFCGSSIYTILVTDQTKLEEKGRKSVSILSKISKTAQIRVHISNRTDQQLAGMGMSFRTISSSAKYAEETEEFSSIRLDFPTSEGLKEFTRYFGECQKIYLQKAQSLKNQRRSQQSLIIETHSH